MEKPHAYNDHGAVVYVMAPDENGPCKIGKTVNVQWRLEVLQIGCWLPLAVWGARLCFDRENSMPGTINAALDAAAYKVEAATHRALKECEVHLHGEWFDITAKEALKAIEVSAKDNNFSAISLSHIASIDLPEYSSDIEKRTFHKLMDDMAAVNAFCRKSIDKIGNAA